MANTLKERKLASTHKAPDDLVFPTSSGLPLEHSNVVKASLIPAVIAAGIVDKNGKAKYTC